MDKWESDGEFNHDDRSWSTAGISIATTCCGEHEENLNGDDISRARANRCATRAYNFCKCSSSCCFWVFGLAMCIVFLSFVAIPILMSSNHTRIFPFKNETTSEQQNHLYHQWRPKCDLQILVDRSLNSGNESHFVLYDESGTCGTISVLKEGTMWPEQPSKASWNDVQPTTKSLEAMHLSPHVLTGDAFLSISSGFEMLPDTNWTLSFAGTRLDSGNHRRADIIFSFPQHMNKKNATQMIRYEANNTLGIYFSSESYSQSWHASGIHLPLDVFDFHVLTLSHNQRDGHIVIYQDAEFVATLDFQYRDRVQMSSLGYNENPASSNLAIRRIASFEQSVDNRALNIASLVLHMLS